MIEPTITDRSTYPFQSWEGLAKVARQDFHAIRFETESEAIDAYRDGDEIYRLADAFAILRPTLPLVTPRFESMGESRSLQLIGFNFLEGDR